MEPTIPFVKQFAATRAIRGELLQRARGVWGKTGPICSGEGLYQHVGECWNDALQIVLLYTDGIKEDIQKQLLTGDFDAMAYRITHDPNFDMYYIEDWEVTPKGEALIDRIKTYLETLQSRFTRQILNHEYMEADAKVKHGVYRAKGVNALTSAVLGAIPTPQFGDLNMGIIYPEKECLKDYALRFTPGGTLIPLLLRSFDVSHIVDHTTIYAPETGHISSLTDIAQIAALIFTTDIEPYSHVTCMYTCNGIDYYADNEVGIFTIPWRFMLQLSSSNKILFVSIIYKNSVMYTNFRHPHIFPAVYNPTENKLFVPNPIDANTFIVLEWDGANHSARWNIDGLEISNIYNIGFISQLSYVPEYKLNRGQYAHALPPTAIGRGSLRRKYLPFNEAAAVVSLQAAPIAKKGGMRRTRRARRGRSRKQRR